MATRRRSRVRKLTRRLMRPLLLAAAVLLVALPAVLTLAYRVLPPPLTPLMVIRALQGEAMNRRWVPLDEIASSLRFAVIAAEDNLFCSHHGFDLESMRDAFADLLEGNRVRGASTISMQTARNLYLWPGRNLVRKAIEAYLTVYLEVLLPKRRIIELYLNIVEWGPGVYGAEAAADHYFGKSAASLSGRESALLASVLPAPRRWSPSPPGDYVRQRSAVVRKRIDQLGPLLDCVRPS